MSEVKDEIIMSENFYKITNDFINDILKTFPECKSAISMWWSSTDDKLNKTEKIHFVFQHCLKVYPDRCDDIIHKNCDIFNINSEINTEFIPCVVFKHLWNCEISEGTKETIWKYLQLMLFSVLNSLKNKPLMNIDEEEFKGKLEETLEHVQSIFNQPTATDSTGPQNFLPPSNLDGMNGLLKGKLGDLAKEIAEESIHDLDIDFSNISDPKDIFQSLFKNPGKLMDLVKNVGSKLDGQIKSGDINESELMMEATELMSKMKNMPGMENMQEMLSKMGMGMGGPKQPTPKHEKPKTKRTEPKKTVDLKEIQDQQSKLDTILNDEQIISLFNEPVKKETETKKDTKKKKEKVH
jgi:hypothetical protein